MFDFSVVTFHDFHHPFIFLSKLLCIIIVQVHHNEKTYHNDIGTLIHGYFHGCYGAHALLYGNAVFVEPYVVLN
jgi:hypothetical protein